VTLEQAKAAVALAGMALAVAGVVLNRKAVVWAAIGVLAVAMVLRMVAARRKPADGTGEPAPPA